MPYSIKKSCLAQPGVIMLSQNTNLILYIKAQFGIAQAILTHNSISAKETMRTSGVNLLSRCFALG